VSGVSLVVYTRTCIHEVVVYITVKSAVKKWSFHPTFRSSNTVRRPRVTWKSLSHNYV